MTMADVACSAIPTWMSKDFFVDVIEASLNLKPDEFQIQNLTVKHATEAGDNFISKLYRVTVEVLCSNGSSQQVPLIVKTKADFGQSGAFVDMLDVFTKETEVYTKILPAFEQLYRDQGQAVSFGPKCLKNTKQPASTLVLEDLQQRQFKMVNRREQLDQNHAKVFLRKIAQFHAASAVYREKNGNFSDIFKEGVYTKQSEKVFLEHARTQQESSLKAVQSWPNGDFYAALMIDGGFSMFSELIAITQPNVDGFNVLNHGDAWCNNMMFQYDNDNSIKEILLLDYQVGVWSSPAIDLLYFIMSSVKGVDRLPQMDNMIYFYYQNLVANLKLLGFFGQIPTLKELHLDVIDRMVYGFATSMGLLPICLMEKTEDASIDMLMSAEDAGRAFRDKMMGNPAYAKQMEELMPFFYEHGVFDLRHSGFQTPSGVESDFLMLPGWMRKEFFHDIVEKKLLLGKEQFSIRNIKVEMATKKGENYGSTMYRAILKVENKATTSIDTFSVIIKTRPDGLAADFCQEMSPFSKEIDMFTRLIPAFENLYKQKGVQVKIGPRCYKTCQSVPSDIIVLEDLCSANFELTRGQAGLKKDQVEETLDKLAQFHAASAVHKELQGDYSSTYKEGLYNRKNLPVMEGMFYPAYDACLEGLKSFPFAKDYIDTLRELRPVAFSRTLETLVVDPSGFNVLNHGDLWMNNLMFRRNSDTNRTEGILLDFQVCFYGSPMLDLNFLLFSSVEKDIKLSKLNHFIRFYHEKLISYLTLLEYGKRLPTLKQLQIDFYDRLVYGAATIFGIGALVLMGPSEDSSFEIFHQDNEAAKRFRKTLYTNERYISTMESLLPYLAKKGAFDLGAELCSVARKKA